MHQIFILEVNAKEMLIFTFSFADGTAKLTRRDYEFREPIQRQESAVRSEDLSGEIQGESGKVSTGRMTLKSVSTSGPSKISSFIVTRMNLEFNTLYRRKKHSPFH